MYLAKGGTVVSTAGRNSVNDIHDHNTRKIDFTIVVFDDEGNKVERKAHKIFLKRSPYFEALFNVEGKEQQAGMVTLDNIPNEAMTHVLNYIYTDDLDVPSEDTADVMIAAEYLQLETLKDECIDTLSKYYAELSADELALSIDKVFKHKLMEPDDCNDMLLKLASSSEWNNLPYLSEQFLGILIEQLSHLPRQCLYWLENWTDLEHEEEVRIEKAKNLLGKLDLLKLGSRDLLECSTSPLLSPSLVLELLRKKAKEEDDGEARDFTFIFQSNALEEFQYEGTHWIVAFYAYSITECEQLEDKKLFEFIKGDPDARLEVVLRSKTQKGLSFSLEPLERDAYVHPDPKTFDAIKKMKAEGFILNVTVSKETEAE